MFKKIALLSLSSFLLLSNMAIADDTYQPFKTIIEAQAHCPALTGLIYIPVPNSASGSIAANFASLGFTNYSPTPASQPQHMSANGAIQNVSWRKADEIPGGFYGFVNLQDNSVTCLYSYTDQYGNAVPLTMSTSPAV